jgi:hypothetical protein
MGLVFVTAMTAMLTTAFILPEPEDAKNHGVAAGGSVRHFACGTSRSANGSLSYCVKRGGPGSEGTAAATELFGGSSASNNEPVVDMLLLTLKKPGAFRSEGRHNFDPFSSKVVYRARLRCLAV